MADEVARAIAEASIIAGAAKQAVRSLALVETARKDAEEYLISRLTLCDDGQVLGPQGRNAGELLVDAKIERPHWFPPEPTKEELLAETSEEIRKASKAAFGKGATPAAQVALCKLVGVPEAKRIAAQWGTSLGSMERGRNPDKQSKSAEQTYNDSVGDDPVTEKNKQREKSADTEAKRKNPWLLPADDARGRELRLGILTRLGPKVAEGLAKAAGVDMAARPLRK